MNDRWSIQCGTQTVSATFQRATDAGVRPVFMLAHGAGGQMNDRGIVGLAALFRARGLHVVRFNFPYTEKGGRRPDPMPVLQSCISTVAARVRTECPESALILGGRSMGGRAASMLVADGFACEGLLLLAYPLHPAGKPDRMRDAHLAGIGAPVLCLNGTRDSLCRRDLMEAVVKRLSANWRMHWIDDADHGFHVRKLSGRTDADVLTEIGDVTRRWMNDTLAAEAPRA